MDCLWQHQNIANIPVANISVVVANILGLVTQNNGNVPFFMFLVPDKVATGSDTINFLLLIFLTQFFFWKRFQ